MPDVAAPAPELRTWLAVCETVASTQEMGVWCMERCPCEALVAPITPQQAITWVHLACKPASLSSAWTGAKKSAAAAATRDRRSTMWCGEAAATTEWDVWSTIETPCEADRPVRGLETKTSLLVQCDLALGFMLDFHFFWLCLCDQTCCVWHDQLGQVVCSVCHCEGGHNLGGRAGPLSLSVCSVVAHAACTQHM